MSTELPFLTRLWFAVYCAFRVLLDGRFARRAWAAKSAAANEHEQKQPSGPTEIVESGAVALDSADEEEEDNVTETSEPGASEAGAGRQHEPGSAGPQPTSAAAISLLRLLQQHGRFVDFLQQDIADFDDGEVGAAARVVHSGCRKVLRSNAEIVPVREEDEESRVTVSTGIKEGIVKLTGDLKGEPPFHGTLRHRGWRIRNLELPTLISGQDSEIVAAAEVEL